MFKQGEYTVKELTKIYQQLSPMLKSIELGFNTDFLKFKIYQGESDCNRGYDRIEQKVLIELTPEGLQKEIILAHEIAHCFPIIYNFPEFPSLYADTIKASDILNRDIRNNAFNFCEHFIVNSKLRGIYGESAVSKVGQEQRKELYNSGTINVKLTGYVKEDRGKEDYLLEYIHLNKALLAVDLYYGLAEDSRFMKRFMEGAESDETKANFEKLLENVTDIGIENLSNCDSKDYITELHERIYQMMQDYPYFIKK